MEIKGDFTVALCLLIGIVFYMILGEKELIEKSSIVEIQALTFGRARLGVRHRDSLFYEDEW